MATKQSPLEKLNKILAGKKVTEDTLVTTLGYEEELQSAVKHYLSTGLLTLDTILGGGWPMGRVVEVFGHEASGKSMLAALACAQAQKQGWLTCYLDTEFAVDQDFFQSLGIDLDKLFYVTPNTLADVFNVLEGMIEFKKEFYSADTPMIFVWDSIASTTNKDVLTRGWEDKGFSTAAIYISNAFQKLRGEFGPNQTLFFLINQTRSNVGVMFGDSYTTYGGKAPKFYSSIRMKLDVEKKQNVGEKGQHKRTVGLDIRAEVIKNKVVTPYRSALLPLNFVEGYIDEAESVLVMLKELGLVTVGGGGNYTIADLSGLGEVKFKKADVPDLVKEYRTELGDLLSAGWLKMPGTSKNGSEPVDDDQEV